MKEDNIKQAIALIWISSVFFGLPFFFLKEWSEAHSTCVGSWSLRMNQASKIYVIICVVLNTYIPIAVFFLLLWILDKRTVPYKHSLPRNKWRKKFWEKETCCHIHPGNSKLRFRIWTLCDVLHGNSFKRRRTHNF